MKIADSFKTLLQNIAVDNHATIELRYGELTCALNQAFRKTDSKTANSFHVGSYGRWTAIKGVSDLDMIYIIPSGSWEIYDTADGQSKLLKHTAKSIQERYPRTTVKVDRLVVRVLYKDFHIEVQPVFELPDGSFKYPDSYNGGSWKITKPREEIEEMKRANAEKNGNLRRLCKMARSWKNKHGVAMGGLLIDTLAHKFLMSTNNFDDKNYQSYDIMSRDFFDYLKKLPDQDRYHALGSGQHVKVKKQFQQKSKKAYDLCVEAISAAGTSNESDVWRKVYGKQFPKDGIRVAKAFVTEGLNSARNTEEFIEDQFPVDVRYDIQLDCTVSQTGFRPASLTDMLRRRVFLKANKSLEFVVTNQSVPEPFHLYWKVKNRGVEAVRRDKIRGQIVADAGQRRKSETTDFRGDHVVECYAVLNGVIVAKDRIHVPITENG